MKVGVVQFVKGKWQTGERAVLEKFPDLVTINTMGEGFTWETQDRQRDIAAARAAWERAKEMIADPAATSWSCSTSSTSCCATTICRSTRCVAFLRDEKPADVHVIVTGRNAKDELIEVADLVTEMEAVKHPSARA